MNFNFVTVVWGEEYVDLFLKVALPSQLASGNLPAFQDLPATTYKIYTTAQDALIIQRSPIFQFLNTLISSEVIVAHEIDIHEKYNAMSEFHKLAIRQTPDSVAMVLLTPDAVWSDGSLANLRRLAEQGKQVVMMPGIRVLKEAFSHTLEPFYSEEQLSLTIAARPLVKLALETLHPVTQAFFWRSEKFSRWGSYYLWEVGTEGLLGRFFHLHPLLIGPFRGRNTNFESTIDCDYIPIIFDGLEEGNLHIVEDSDEMVFFDLRGALQDMDQIEPGRSNPLRIAYWAAQGANACHRKLIQYKIRFHTQDCTPSPWQEGERESDLAIEKIFFWLQFEWIFHLIHFIFNKIKVLLKSALTPQKIEKLQQIKRTLRKMA